MGKFKSEEALFERMRHLADIGGTSINENKNRKLGDLIDYKRGADGVAYGIVKENHNFFIKKSNSKEPDVADFAYIGGLENIHEHRYTKLSEADKNRNMLLATINEALQGKGRIISEAVEEAAEEEIEAAEEKLKDAEAAAEEPVPAEPEGGEEMPDLGGEEAPEGGEEMPDLGGEEAPEGGEEMPDLGGEEAPEGGEEMPDLGGEETPEGGEEEVGVDVDALDVSDEEVPEGGEDAPEDVDLDININGDEKESEDAPEGDEEGDGGMFDNEEKREINSKIGKLAQRIRETDFNEKEIKSLMGSFLSAFENEMPELDISVRKEIADDYLLKVVPDEDIDAAGVEVERETEMAMDEEKMCKECGFAKYAESMGYGDADTLMECGTDEMANLMSGYAMEQEGEINEEDYESMAVLADDAVMESLAQEYGHEELAEGMKKCAEQLNEESADPEAKKKKIEGMFWWKVKPQEKKDTALKTLSENEDYDEEQGEVPGEQDTGPDEYDHEVENEGEFREYANTVLKQAHGEEFDTDKAEYFIDGLIKMAQKGEEEDWGEAIGILQQSLDEEVLKEISLRGLKNVGQWGGEKVADVGKAIGGAAQRAVKGVAGAVTNKIDQATQKLDQLGNEITQVYQKGVKGDVEKKLQKAAQEFGELVMKLDQASQKAGDGPLNKQQFLMQLQGVLKGTQPQMAAEGMGQVDTLNTQVQPPMSEEDVVVEPETNDAEVDSVDTGVAPAFQPMGADVVKPDGAETTGVDVEVNKDAGTVNVSMNESETKLRKYVRARLEEKAGLRKPVLNEDKKSDKIKLLDKMIDEQYQLFEGMMNEDVASGMGKISSWIAGDFKKKKKIQQMLPNLKRPEDIRRAFRELFEGKIRKSAQWAMKDVTPEKQLELINQALTDKGGIGTIEGSGTGELVYKPTQHGAATKASEFGRGRSRLGVGESVKKK